MFACPSCKADLSRTEGEQGIVWLCVKCKGRAINIALLRKLVERTHFNRVWQTALENPQRSERKCPACRKSMVEAPVTPPPNPLILDVCKPCQFVWFDAAEFERMPAAPPPPPQAELPAAAKQIIAEHKVRMLAERARQAESADDWLTLVQSVFRL